VQLNFRGSGFGGIMASDVKFVHGGQTLRGDLGPPLADGFEGGKESFGQIICSVVLLNLLLHPLLAGAHGVSQ
jgi:hypothetical protein